MQCRLFCPFQTALSCTIALLAASAPLRAAEKETVLPIHVPYRKLAQLQKSEISESSGLACSRRTADVFWTHNDSGDKARVFAFDKQGLHRGTFVIKKAKNRDWEDMASFTLDGQRCLLLADIGDNVLKAKFYKLYLVEEPELDEIPAENERLNLLQTVYFRYTDGAHDCEAMAFDATERRAYFAVKSATKSSDIYMLQWPPMSNSKDSAVIAERITAVAFPLVTGMDISPDGRRAVLLTYGLAYEFVRNESETWEQAFSRPATPLIMPFRRQGESICYGPEANMLYLTSEKTPTPLFEANTSEN